MTTSKRLAAFRAAQPSEEEDETEIPAPDGPGEDETEEEAPASKKKDKPMTTENTDQAALDTARTEGFAAANARFNAVLASDEYTGRETLAKTLLSNDKLNAEEIIGALATAPKAAPAQVAAEEDDAAGREAMRQNLAAEQPPATTTAESSEETTTADDSLMQSMKARFPTAK